MEKGYLVGDIGGTNSRLRLILGDKTIEPNEPYQTRVFTALEFIINDFLRGQGVGASNVKACIGVPGPVKEGTYCKSPVIDHWEVMDRNKILKSTGLSELILINDFEALGWGINCLKEPDYMKLNNVKPEEKSNKCVIGAGTGLGVCGLMHDKIREIYFPFPSEGGHSIFLAKDLEEYRCMQFIKKKEKEKGKEGDIICNKAFLSGEGLRNIHSFKGGENNLTVDAIIEGQNDQIISSFTCDAFSKAYGRFANTAALFFLCPGGLYIAGGIAIKNPCLVDNDIFKRQFGKVCSDMKGTEDEKSIIDRIPLFLLKREDLALDGALFYLTKIKNA